MKLFLTINLISILFTSMAQAMTCTGETYSGKKISISFGEDGAYPTQVNLTGATIYIDHKAADSIDLSRLSLETNHDQIKLKTLGGLPALNLMFAENASPEDKLSRMTVVLSSGKKFSFKDVDCVF